MVVLKFLVDGVDITAKVDVSSVDIVTNDGAAIDVASFEVWDSDSSITAIKRDKDLIIEDASDPTIRYFGGVVAEVSKTIRGLGILYTVTGQGWVTLLERAFFTQDYVGATDQFIIQDAFTQAGITEIDTSSRVGVTSTLDRVQFRSSSLRQMLETISGVTGYIWFVDPFKKLVYQKPESLPAAFALSDNPDNVDTFPYQQINLQEEFGQFNSVEVVGGRKFQQAVDTYSGDGVRTTFDLQIDGRVQGNVYHRFFRGPEGANPDVVIVRRNTGSDASPTWTAQTVEREGSSSSAPVLWNPLTNQVIWKTAPPNFPNNSWQIEGRYLQAVSWVQDDEDAIASSGRVFRKVIVRRDVESDEQAADIARAFLDKQGPSTRVRLMIDKEGLNPGDRVLVTNSLLGLNQFPARVREIKTRIQGGSTLQQSLVLGQDRFSLAETMLSMKENLSNLERDITAGVVVIKLVKGDLTVTVTENLTIVLGWGDTAGNYFVEPSVADNRAATMQSNEIDNPSFEGGAVTPWQLFIDPDATLLDNRVDNSVALDGSNSWLVRLTHPNATDISRAEIPIKFVPSNDNVLHPIAYCWIYLQASLSTGSMISMEVVDGAGNIVSSTWQRVSLSSSTSTGVWHPIGMLLTSGYDVADFNTGPVSVRIKMEGSGTFHFNVDCAVFTRWWKTAGLTAAQLPTTEYFDGDSPAGPNSATDETTLWEGIAHQSVSSRNPNGKAAIAEFSSTAAGLLLADRLNRGLLQFGLESNKPAAGESGRLYYATDTPLMQYDDGSNWNAVAAMPQVLYATKSADETRSTTVLTDDGTLKILVDANHTYIIRCVLLFSGGKANVSLNVPAGATFSIDDIGGSILSPITWASGGSGLQLPVLYGRVVVGATPGFVILQWAKLSAGEADITLGRGILQILTVANNV